MSVALDGILVVSIEQAVAAPLASCRLADAGARVIKIERPEGDFARRYDTAAGGESAYFVWLNRGKESVVLDLKVPADAELLTRLLARADVFIQNLAPGAAARLGCDSATLRRRHPRLITCDISGFGDHGPHRERRAYDLLVQAESGVAAITGGPERPGRVGVSICDIATGMFAHAAILEALLTRERTGAGQALAVSLFASMAEWMTVPLLFHDYAGETWPRLGLAHPSIAPYGVYPLGDSSELLIGIQNDGEFRRLAEHILGQAQLADDPRFAVNSARVQHRAALDAIVAAALATIDRDQAAARLDDARIAYGFLSSVGDLSRHPQLRRVALATPSGALDIPAPPVTIDGESRRLRRVPALGEHTAAVRRELG